MDYLYADIWGDYDDYSVYMGKEEEEEAESEITDKTDVITEQITKVAAERTDELAVEVEEKEEKPHRPIDVTRAW